MGFVFLLMGAFAGMWFMSDNAIFGGFAFGALFGWLLHKLLTAETTIRRLLDRVDSLEQRNAVISVPDPARKVAAKTLDTPARVSVYEPSAVVEAAKEPQPEVVVHEHEPVPPIPAAPPKTPAPAAKPNVATSVREAARPAQPGIADHAIEVAKRWLTTGNVPVKVGVIISFFGVGFLLKYAVENEVFTIPMSVRYLAVAAFAAVLLVIGWRKREENRVFALSIQGGGIGVLFLTIFAAFRLHGLLSPTIAFGLLVLVTAAAGYLAIRQESRAFAILGTTGGFLAPLLVSTGSGNHVALFSYYLLLNSAVLGVAWYRPWRELNIIGFGFTFGIGTIWGYQYYVPELFSTTEPFLILYFLFYTIIAVLFAFRQRPQLRGYVDGTLLFGTPTIAFALQTQLLGDTEYGLAISAAVVAVFYAAMALWLKRTQEKNFELLTQAFVALAVAFGTIAIPLALDDRWTAIAWALEGAALVWIGVRQKTTLAKMTGTALAFGSGAEFMNFGWVSDLGIPVLNGNFMGGALIAFSALYSAWMLQADERGRDWQKVASVALLVWGLAWWFGTGFAEISDRASYNTELLIAVIYFGASFAAMLYAANRLRWLPLWHISVGVLPLVGGLGLIAHGWTNDLGIPVLNGNFLGAALIAWMSLYASRKLRTDERGGEELKALSIALLCWGLLFWFGGGTMEINDRLPNRLVMHALLLFGTLSLAAIAFAGKRFDWIAYRRVSLALLPFLLVAAFAYLIQHEHFFKGLGALGWLVAIAAHGWVLHCCGNMRNRATTLAHGWGAMFFVMLIAFEVSWQVDRFAFNDVWPGTAGLLTLATGAFALLFEGKDRKWPFSEDIDAYYVASQLLAGLFIVLVIAVCINDPGSPSPLPYIPVLNPFDVLSVVALVMLWRLVRRERKKEYWGLDKASRVPEFILGGTALLLSTIAVVRAVHHFTGVAWESSALMGSVGVQSTLSIYWAILGLSGMVLGTKRAQRSIWMSGAGLMIVVVLKLFVIDLGNTGTVARIISFLGVGVMLLVVGYFSPVPPKLDSAEAQSES
jgi:uncharacterized membrane protein